MPRRRTETVLVTRWDGVAARRGPDELIVEEPMVIQLDGVLAATTMRTPGHDYELAVGYCLTEGLLAGAPVESVRYCATGSATETDRAMERGWAMAMDWATDSAPASQSVGRQWNARPPESRRSEQRLRYFQRR